MQTDNAVTKQQLRAALDAVFVAAEALREIGEMPAGTLYAALMGIGITQDGFNGLVRTLKGAGLVEETASHLLRWVGPAKEVRR